jgi:prepilin-type N-terminal cleavage/methylation domain-containing protein
MDIGSARPGTRVEDGFSLIELVVAMLILAVMSMAIIGVIINAQSQTVTNRSRIAAANLAARELDIVREEFTRTQASPAQVYAEGTKVNPHPLRNQTAGDPLRVDGRAYTVTRDVQWNITGSGQSACAGGALVNYPTLQVRVSVTWPNMRSTKPVVSTAALAPRKDDQVLGTVGYVAVKVSDSLGSPSSGRTVKVWSTGETKTALTDASGCAVVQVNPAGGAGTGYQAQTSDTGFVDIAGTTGPSKSVGQVKQGQLNNGVTFTVDRASTLTVQLVDEAGAPVDPAAIAGGVITLVAGESVGATSSKVVAVTGPTMTVSGLWPTQYGAYWGTAPPGTGYSSTKILAGGTGTVTVVVPVMAP